MTLFSKHPSKGKSQKGSVGSLVVILHCRWVGNVLYRLSYLKTQFPVGGAVWGRGWNSWDDTVLLEEACHWGRALRMHSLALLPVYSLHFLCAVECGLSTSCVLLSVVSPLPTCSWVWSLHFLCAVECGLSASCSCSHDFLPCHCRHLALCSPRPE